MFTGDDISDADIPLLHDVVPGFVDFKSRPSVRSKSGCWKSASFLIGVEIAERFSYSGISSNLMSYLTGSLGQSTAAAAANLNVWYGTATLAPILGALVADAFLGRYRTIIVSSLLYIMALGFLTLSAALNSSSCISVENSTECSPSQFHKIFFFVSLYLVAIAQGGHMPCTGTFGADQFDVEDEKESVAKSSFFNWWTMISCLGILLAFVIMNYIQENLSWVLGFGIPCILMCFSLLIFLLGTKTYRFTIVTEEKKNAVLKISQLYNDICEAEIFRLAPLWCTILGYGIIYAQPSTLFTKQATTLDRHITSTIQIPAATFQSFIVGSIVVFVALYDRIFVPIARAITKKPSGISMLQRIGTGIFLSIVSIAVAAIVEKKRLATAEQYGLLDDPKAIIPMSVWWIVPQYIVSGIADVFAMVGIQEFFYDQVPNELKTMGISLYLSVLGISSFVSSFVVSVVQKMTSGNGRDGWIVDNLNRAHLDYFYWLLAGIGAFSFAAFIYFAKSYVYVRRMSA